MRKIVSICIFAFLLYSCGSVAITGRRQVLLYNSGDIAALSDESYKEVMSTSAISKNAQQTRMVQDVGTRLVQAVTNYMSQNGKAQQLSAYTWGFTLLESQEVNAFCLPNGKIVVYEGLMKYASTADRLAVVVGHEIAHAIANHGNERMSQETLVNMLGAAGSAILANKSEVTQAIFGTAFGLGSTYGVLMPYSRTHEYEADRLGLIFMAMAGYDPNQAITFWEMMSASSGPKPPEFMSTHPSDAHRIAKIKEVIPEALQYAPRR